MVWSSFDWLALHPHSEKLRTHATTGTQITLLLSKTQLPMILLLKLHVCCSDEQNAKSEICVNNAAGFMTCKKQQNSRQDNSARGGTCHPYSDQSGIEKDPPSASYKKGMLGQFWDSFSLLNVCNDKC